MAGVIIESILFAVLVAVYRVMKGTDVEIALVSGITIFIVSFIVLSIMNRRNLRKMQKEQAQQKIPDAVKASGGGKKVSSIDINHNHKKKKKKKK